MVALLATTFLQGRQLMFRMTATLTFLEDGLRVVVTLERK
jgi:hypothetical protein